MNAKNWRTRFFHFSYFFFHTKYHENRNLWKLECSIKNRLFFILFRTYSVSRKIEIVRRTTHFITESVMRFKFQLWYILDDSLWLCCMKRMIYNKKKFMKREEKRRNEKWKWEKREFEKLFTSNKNQQTTHFSKSFSNVMFLSHTTRKVENNLDIQSSIYM
jgi:hypothetical protein